MDKGLSPLESRVVELERALRVLEQRVAAIEPRPGGPPLDTRPPSPEVSPGPGADIAHSAGVDLISVLSLIGRTCVIIGGAYLLRALTESEWLPTPVGVAVGFGYAASCLALGDRSAKRRHTLSATFYGLAYTLIAFPLLWETVMRFRLTGAGGASLLLTVVILAALTLSVRRHLQALAWISVLAALALSISAVAVTGSIVPFAISDIALGVATLWIGYTLDWVLLRWPVAIVADITVLALAVGVSSRTVADAPSLVISTQLLLLIGYLASIVIRTLFRGREVVPFEIFQGSAALAVGFGGAVHVAQTTTSGRTILVVISLLCGVACYGIAFAFVARRQGMHRNFYFYTSLAVVLVLASTGLLLDEAAMLWATLAVLASWAARRFGRIALNLHGAVYAVAAAMSSGLLASATSAFVGATVTPAPFPPAMLVVLAALCVCWSIPLAPAAQSWGSYSRLPRLAVAIGFTWSAAAWIVTLMIGGISPTTDAASPEFIATARTAGLAATALALAGVGRLDRFREAAWLVYPVLVAGGVKLIAEDFSRSRPAALFIALALYGGALIAAPRLAHSDRRDRQ
jgi:hypothetical protein